MLRDAWDSVTQETLVNSWHNLWPETLFLETDEDREFSGFKPSLAKIKTAELMNYALNRDQFANLKEEKVLEFLQNDEESEIVSHHLTDAEIISSVLTKQGENDSDTESDTQEEEEQKLSITEGLSIGEKYLKFLETQDCVSEQELLTVHRLQQKIYANRLQTLKQSKIDDLFRKQTKI